MANKGTVGMLMYCLGICITVIAGAKLPDEGQRWSSVLYLFQDGVILTIIGLILWYQAPKKDVNTEEDGQRTPYQLLRDVQPIIEDLYRSVDDLECYQIQEYVKILREQYLVPLESKRGEIIQRFGMEGAADLLIAVSYGERIVNRVHSASLDGHHDEAVECTEEAHAVFQEIFLMVRQLWKA